MEVCLTKQTFIVGLKAPGRDTLQINGCLYLHLLHTPVNELGDSTACKNKCCVPQTQLSFQESPISINAHKLRTDRWKGGFLTSYTYVLDSPSMHITIKL